MDNRLEATRKMAAFGLWGLAGSSFGFALIVAGVIGLAATGIPIPRLAWALSLVLVGAVVAIVGGFLAITAREGVEMLRDGTPE
ncbi:MAG: hypothetical protein V3W32_11290 [Gemmatimonadota bacterium]